MNFHRIAWSQVSLQLHKFIFLGISVHRLNLYKHFCHPFLGAFSPRTKCLNYQLLDHLLVGASLKISSYSPVLHNGHVCSQKK